VDGFLKQGDIPMNRMNSWTVFLGSILVLGILVGLLAWRPRAFPGRPETPPLFIYCGAGIRAPVDAAAKEYENDYGVPFVFQYGPSQTLVAQAEISKTGDLILPGDDTFIDLALEKGLIDGSVPLARMVPVLAVAKAIQSECDPWTTCSYRTCG
jgi:molybdate transport system substrate-binding protein